MIYITHLPLLVELLLDLVDAFLANLAHLGEVQAAAHTNNWRKSLVTKRISHFVFKPDIQRSMPDKSFQHLSPPFLGLGVLLTFVKQSFQSNSYLNEYPNN